MASERKVPATSAAPSELAIALLKATDERKLGDVKACLARAQEQKVSPQDLFAVRNATGYDAIVLACADGDTEMVKAFLAFGADPFNSVIKQDSRDGYVRPILFAVYQNHLAVVELILKTFRAGKHRVEDQNAFEWMIANVFVAGDRWRHCVNTQMAAIIYEYAPQQLRQCEPTATDYRGLTALAYAMRRNLPRAAARLYLETSKDVPLDPFICHEQTGNTFLMEAVAVGSLPLINELLNSHVNPRVTNRAGETVFAFLPDENLSVTQKIADVLTKAYFPKTGETKGSDVKPDLVKIMANLLQQNKTQQAAIVLNCLLERFGQDELHAALHPANLNFNVVDTNSKTLLDWSEQFRYQKSLLLLRLLNVNFTSLTQPKQSMPQVFVSHLPLSSDLPASAPTIPKCLQSLGTLLTENKFSEAKVFLEKMSAVAEHKDNTEEQRLQLFQTLFNARPSDIGQRCMLFETALKLFQGIITPKHQVIVLQNLHRAGVTVAAINYLVTVRPLSLDLVNFPDEKGCTLAHRVCSFLKGSQATPNPALIAAATKLFACQPRPSLTAEDKKSEKPLEYLATQDEKTAKELLEIFGKNYTHDELQEGLKPREEIPEKKEISHGFIQRAFTVRNYEVIFLVLTNGFASALLHNIHHAKHFDTLCEAHLKMAASLKDGKVPILKNLQGFAKSHIERVKKEAKLAARAKKSGALSPSKLAKSLVAAITKRPDADASESADAEVSAVAVGSRQTSLLDADHLGTISERNGSTNGAKKR